MLLWSGHLASNWAAQGSPRHFNERVSLSHNVPDGLRRLASRWWLSFSASRTSRDTFVKPVSTKHVPVPPPCPSLDISRRKAPKVLKYEIRPSVVVVPESVLEAEGSGTAGDGSGQSLEVPNSQDEESRPTERGSTVEENTSGHTLSGLKRPSGQVQNYGNKDGFHGNDDGDGQKPKKQRVQLNDPEFHEPRRLACPFYKHSPQTYKYQPQCVGPGWQTVSRVKEHIYRRHTQSSLSFSCPRCFAEFPAQSALQDHLRQTTVCLARASERNLEGMVNSSQIMMLKKRGKKSATEVERWFDVYRILFPAVPPGKLPSPCNAVHQSLLFMGFH